MENTTESNSRYDHLEQVGTTQVLQYINQEDTLVPQIVNGCIPSIAALVDEIIPRMKNGGRLLYMGAGTSGRLGIVDASECPPTFGVPHDWVIGIIAGGDDAIRHPVEGAEDNAEQGKLDLLEFSPSSDDVLVGIAASGRTPYVIGAIEAAKELGMITGSITCNAGSPMALLAQFPIVAVVGPEVVTGSTRMKSGTAQKLILNMISTTVMIGLGRVVGNKMVDMQLSNQKLILRGSKMVSEKTGLDLETAKGLLLQHGSVRKAVQAFESHA
ncbi:MAG: N-acetylmuramic acid 6-phosphate etherase [Bacteroidetes bacterium]|nr:N-acetylmuramic acid 6-phosphate etherase [Bacteroidota bacterium]